jgi:serine phosphatase RsbU (regulator of sigma subunit)
MLYLFTDGLPDQFGGPKGKKFKYKKFQEILVNNSGDSIGLQKDKLLTEFTKWKGSLEQLDDVCVIGIRI